MKKFLSDNWIFLIIGLSFVTSTIFAIRNNYVIEQNYTVQQQTDLVKQRTSEILSLTMHGLDLGVRGFGLTRDEKLLTPYRESIQKTPDIFAELDSLLAMQGYSARADLEKVKLEVDQYIKFSNQMIELAKANQMDAFGEMLKEDRGYQVWSKYAAFQVPLIAYEDGMKNQSVGAYRNAIKSNLVIQITILILLTPMLLFFIQKMKNERLKREAVLNEVDRTDRSFVFNPGDNSQALTEDINKRSITNVKRASEFIASLALGKYDVEWQGLTKDKESINKQTLAGNLVNLREKLRMVKLDDERRNWANEGLAQFSEIVRNNQNNHEDLAVKTISFLTQYMQAQQGSLFVQEGEENDLHLRLAGCYAFDRRKWLEKRIEIGSGMVGQVYLEGESVIFTDVPKGYTSITSGLGHATPDCIMIIPMKNDDKTVAIAEFATFNIPGQHQIQFLEKAGAYLASAIINTRTTLKMKTLLTEATEREEMLREREEELRQNMEELQATQEDIMRKRIEPLRQQA
jgi:CHASE3 domain sensor protein